MRRTVKIFALILIYFLTCGKSCDNEEKNDDRREQVRVKAETDSIRSVFGTDTLSVLSLVTYLETAKQKFYDFNDYLQIIADTSAADPFRNKAREMIRTLFIPGGEPVRIIRPFGLESVNTKEDFRRINDSVYEGSLVFSFTPQQPGKTVSTVREKGTIKVFLLKIDKNFGREKLRVWNVLLGKIE